MVCPSPPHQPSYPCYPWLWAHHEPVWGKLAAKPRAQRHASSTLPAEPGPEALSPAASKVLPVTAPVFSPAVITSIPESLPPSPSSSPSCYPSRSRSRSRSPSLVAAAPSVSTGSSPSPSLCDSPSHAPKAPCSVCSQYGTAPGQISFFRRLICRNAACPRYRPYVVVVREHTWDGIRNRLSPGAADRAYRIDAPFRDLEARRRSGDLSGFPRLDNLESDSDGSDSSTLHDGPILCLPYPPSRRVRRPVIRFRFSSVTGLVSVPRKGRGLPR